MLPAMFALQADPLRRWRRLAPERVALVDRVGDDRLTYRALDAEVDRWAGALRAAGIGRGDVVATLAPNRRELVALLFACLRTGAALAPLDAELPAAALGAVLANARPRLVVGTSCYRSRAECALADAGTRPVWLDLDADVERWLARGRCGSDVPVQLQDRVLIVYPGAARESAPDATVAGAVIPQRQILYNGIATAMTWELGHGDVAPVASPLHESAGWNALAMPLWLVGGTVVLVDDFRPEALLETLAGECATMACLAPAQLRAMAERLDGGDGLFRLRFIVAGHGAMNGALHGAADGAVHGAANGGARGPAHRPADTAAAAAVSPLAGRPVRQGFGLTECGPNCFITPDDAAPRGPGAVGWPVAFLETRVVGEDGREVGPGVPGDLQLRGPQVFGGFLRDPERTARVLGRDGWLRTGRRARRDEDGAHTICDLDVDAAD